VIFVRNKQLCLDWIFLYSQRKDGFDPMPLYVRSVVGTVAMEQDFLRVLLFFLVSLKQLSVLVSINMLIFPEDHPGEGWIPYKMQCCFRNLENWIEKSLSFSFLFFIFFTDESLSFTNLFRRGLYVPESN